MKLWFNTDGSGDGMIVTRTANVRLDSVVGMKCRSRRPFVNGTFNAPAGTLFVIDGTGPLLKLEVAEPCPHCKISGRITRIEYRDVVIQGEPPDQRSR